MPVSRPSRLLTVLALAVALAAFPLGALASHDFADVPDSNPFHADISALAASGVTTGCGGGNYCPSAFVTREQMAAFMNRLGALAAGKTPVVNADKLDGLDSTDFLAGGDMVHTYGPTAWQRYGTDTSGTVEYYPYRLGLSRSGAGDIEIQISPMVPTSEHGIGYALESVTICATGSVSGYLNAASLSGQNSADPNATPTFNVDDSTDRTAYGCHTLSVPTPTAAGFVSLYLLATFTGAADLDIHSTTFTWTPLP